MELQTQALDKLQSYCKKNNTRFIILFPPGISDEITFTQALAGRNIEKYCMENNIEFLNIYHFIKDLPINRRIANPFDHHPSAEVNKIVAKKLLEMIENKSE